MAASKKQTSLLYKSGLNIRTAVVGTWGGIEVVRDPYTEANKGLVALTYNISIERIIYIIKIKDRGFIRTRE